MTDPIGWQLGHTSEHYESGGNGPATISSGKGDPGGVSYGTYQLSSSKGTLREYLSQSAYGDHFRGLEPVTLAFNAKWRELANDGPGFGQDQHGFIKAEHYDKQVAHLKANGLDLADRGPAVKDLLWSTSVQYRDLTPGIVKGGLKETFGKDYKLASLSDNDIVNAVQNYKIAHNDQLFKSSPIKTQQSILDRAKAEKVDLLSLADGKLIDHNAHQLHAHSDIKTPRLGAHDDAIGALQHDLSALGYTDRRGKPLHADAIGALQHDLSALGYTDRRGKPLHADKNFGRDTDAAVRAFQQDHGLLVDGVAGTDTLGAIHHQRHAQSHNSLTREVTNPLASLDTKSTNGEVAAIKDGVVEHKEEKQAAKLQTVAGASPSIQPNVGLDDPRNAFSLHYSLYNELKTRIPDASENRLLQFTVACQANRITADNLSKIYLDESNMKISFHGASPLATPASVDISSPPPQPQQSIQHVQQNNQQQTQMTGQNLPQSGQVSPMGAAPDTMR